MLFLWSRGGQTKEDQAGETEQAVGLVFYQAGVAVITGSVFTSTLLSASSQLNSAGEDWDAVFTGSNIQTNSQKLGNASRASGFQGLSF